MNLLFTFGFREHHSWNYLKKKTYKFNILTLRSQQAAERWQARYEEKNQEVLKLEASLHLAKSAISRLEKEKRMLLTRLNEAKSK